MRNEPPMVRLARYAMGARFEAVLFGEDETQMRAAGEAALDEIEYYSSYLDLFRKDSFLSFINRTAYEKPVRIDGDLMELIEHCLDVSRLSEGAFDITVGPLMECWGFHNGRPSVPKQAMLDTIRTKVGFEKLFIDKDQSTVRFTEPEMRIDFGAVAKGFALDRAGEILKESGPLAALIHGGTSSVLAIGAPPGEDGWKVALKAPSKDESALKIVTLHDCALSVSAPHGRSFIEQGEMLGHVMDPVKGAPVKSADLAAVVCKSAAKADAWSTAFLVLAPDAPEKIDMTRNDMTALIHRKNRFGDSTQLIGHSPKVFKDPGSQPGVQEVIE